MKSPDELRFGPFRLDPANERLWRDDEEVKLRPKTFAMLCYLADRPGRLVTKEELVEALWPDTTVGDGALAVCLGEVRAGLGDDARKPSFIETVHRRGFRFVAAIERGTPPAPSDRAATTVVGRHRELAELHGWLARARGGDRVIGFVTGDAGIGKTTLVETFLRRVEHAVPVARGQCLDHYGAGEAYLPVLEAMGRLLREPDAESALAVMEQYAPSWLVQLPGLLTPARADAVQRRAVGANPARMLRELAQALEVLTATRPLILVLEDLHWSDRSTLDLLASLARRRERARLLVLGTYRPADTIARAHPLRIVTEELALHGLCETLALDTLAEPDVAQYLAARYGSPALPAGVASAIYRRTEGHPLFMVNVVEHLLQHGDAAIAGAVPESLRQTIEGQLDRLDPADLRTLEAASVAGVTFAVPAVAAGIGDAVETVEERCDRLARQRRFVRAAGTEAWPDGTVGGGYAFAHALYQQVLYERIPVARRMILHQRIGERSEAGWAADADAHAAQLALHFERARDHERTLRYRRGAADNAVRRGAFPEARDHLCNGLAAIQALPDSPERARQELAMQLALGPVVMATRGDASADVERVYVRARELCRHVGTPAQEFEVCWGLWRTSLSGGQTKASREIAVQLLTAAEHVPDAAMAVEAHRAVGQSSFYLGDLASARLHLERSVVLHRSGARGAEALPASWGMATGSLVFLALTLWSLGEPDEALQRTVEAVGVAEESGHPSALSFALTGMAWVHVLRGDGPAAQQRAQAAMAVASEHGLPQRWARAAILEGRALVEQGHVADGIARMLEGLRAHRATGAAVGRPHNLALLAEGHLRAGDAQAGIDAVDEALAMVHATGERWWKPELYRLRGELMLLRSPDDHAAAEESFRTALEVARTQHARALERRAATSLARLSR